jgi:hypothetical protein
MQLSRECELRRSLHATMETWLSSSPFQANPDCYIGENGASHMAEAALAVLMGMVDLEEFLKNEKMLASP